VIRHWRSALVWFAATLALAVGFHYGTIVAYPRLLMSLAERKLSAEIGKNVVRHRGGPNPAHRIVVSPSPDLIYSVIVFDLSEAALHITAPITGTYMSLSLYAENTDNFFVMNDRQVTGGKFDIVLAGQEVKDTPIPGAQLVRSPSKTGIALIRYFIGDGKQAEQIKTRQKQIQCDILGKAS
jgi:uncharacterized membrane protein